ncbi:hypothetical protein [Dyella sp. A6]|uniref:hypothetical protein n=1 Tax=Dyella aluminiiresistens TaxID=3069105 RepID=UPI002E7A7FAE|nr:hypothetical protein [Dyella sp. A6]
MSGLRPEHVAFLGECSTTTQDSRTDVQVLCWPTVPATWSMLAHALEELQALRGNIAGEPGLTWTQDAAPQLSRPVDREPNAVESTLAALIRRLPLRFAVAVVEHQTGRSKGSDIVRHRSLFSGCLMAYEAYLKSSRQAACRLVIAAAGDAVVNELRRTAFDEALSQLTGTANLKGLELGFWSELATPLPMEVSQLAAVAVGRHLRQPSEANPIFETVRAHLAPPSRFHAMGQKKRSK